MNRIVKAALISFVLLSTLDAAAADADKAKPKPQSDLLLRCLYSASANAATSTTAPAQSLGFNFILQRNNENHVAVDVFSLNENKKPIKQIGHSELIGSVSSTAGELTLAEDSPFEFSIEFKTGIASATVTVLQTFAGENYANLIVQCMQPEVPQGERGNESSSKQTLR